MSINAQVFTLPQCSQCEEWKQYFDRNDVEYKEISLRHPASQKYLSYMLENKMMSAPLVRLFDEEGALVGEYNGAINGDPLEGYLSAWD